MDVGNIHGVVCPSSVTLWFRLVECVGSTITGSWDIVDALFLAVLVVDLGEVVVGVGATMEGLEMTTRDGIVVGTEFTFSDVVFAKGKQRSKENTRSGMNCISTSFGSPRDICTFCGAPSRHASRSSSGSRREPSHVIICPQGAGVSERATGRMRADLAVLDFLGQAIDLTLQRLPSRMGRHLSQDLTWSSPLNIKKCPRSSVPKIPSFRTSRNVQDRLSRVKLPAPPPPKRKAFPCSGSRSEAAGSTQRATCAAGEALA
ncbi:hypothetical protein RRG08_010237 [Elysia crispata]|uniref:Uncharacterized protein n=1 Tax=Elysia crispata TaxID=231223 RepID=A0AAE0Z165_9GAST|nr:hypothetical protein RRG08_010237 [Elysia crispata]